MLNIRLSQIKRKAGIGKVIIYVREHPILKWDSLTAILYAGKDNLTERYVVDDFCARFHSDLSVMEKGGIGLILPNGSYGSGNDSYVVGNDSYGFGDGSYEVGNDSYAVGNGSYGFGDGSYEVGNDSYAVGNGSYQFVNDPTNKPIFLRAP